MTDYFAYKTGSVQLIQPTALNIFFISPIFFIYLFIYLFTYLFIYLFIYLSTWIYENDTYNLGAWVRSLLSITMDSRRCKNIRMLIFFLSPSSLPSCRSFSLLSGPLDLLSALFSRILVKVLIFSESTFS